MINLYTSFFVFGRRNVWELVKVVTSHCHTLYMYLQTELRNTPDNINRSQPTNVMYLTRFAPPTDSSSPDMLSFETHICSLLDSAPYQALPLKTLQDKLV